MENTNNTNCQFCNCSVRDDNKDEKHEFDFGTLCHSCFLDFMFDRITYNEAAAMLVRVDEN
jgi:hypothetical protein